MSHNSCHPLPSSRRISNVARSSNDTPFLNHHHNHNHQYNQPSSASSTSSSSSSRSGGLPRQDPGSAQETQQPPPGGRNKRRVYSSQREEDDDQVNDLSEDAGAAYHHGAPHPDHGVQFYTDPADLCRAVCQFAAEGIGQGAGVVVVARRLHRKGIERALAERGVDVAACHASGQLSMPDADTVLRDFLAEGGMPDPGRFWAIFGSLVDAHLARFRHLRIYGEMVDILWSSDRRPAAIEFENLWSQLAARQEQRGRPFSLLCGYAVGHFGCEEQTRAFLDLCGTHGRVVPAKSYETLREHHNSQQHLIARLQQQALALQAEVAHRRAVEAELQLAKERAEAANQAKSMFLAVISHELRTPLTAIVGYADLMLASSSSSSAAAGEMPASERGEIVEVISRNGRELVRLLNDVLDLSKVEAGSLQIDSVPFSPVELVSDVASVLRLQAREKQLSMRINIGPDVPARVLGDPSRLRQILVNLTSNAVKFTPAGGIIDMALRMRPPPVDSPPLLECIVRDTGCGMTPEHAQQLFQPFSQGETSASRQHGGAGLGLFLSRQLARLLGGDLVLAQTAPGQGTTFVATVPANTPTIIPDALEDQQAADGLALSRCELNDEQTMTSWSPPPDRQLQPIDCAAISVLVVDDNSVNRRLIQRVLQRLGYVDVACTANGLEALNHMTAHHCDLILMDLQMPMMGGHAACRAIRKIYQDQQRVQQPVIIALTAQVLGDERDQCLASGMDDFLSKPFDFNVLKHKLSHWTSTIVQQQCH